MTNYQNRIKQKEALCIQAEEHSNSTSWKETHELFKKLQNQWKQVGSGPKHLENPLWHRFRAATDNFYRRRQEYFTQRDQDRAQRHEEWLQHQAIRLQRHQEWRQRQEAALVRKSEQHQRIADSIRHDELNIARWHNLLSSIRPGNRAAEIHSRTLTKIQNVQAKIDSKIRKLQEIDTQIADIQYNLGQRIFEPEGKVFRDMKRSSGWT